MKYLKISILWSVIYLLSSNSYAQDDHFKTFEKNLTPSPTVKAFENFGGIELKKNTGGVQKSIPLFTMKEGDLNYSPSIEYFSTGIRVDDWGSSVGMGWTENLTAVISRTVKGIPDEKAYSRVSDSPDALGGTFPDFSSSAVYNTISEMALPNTTKDGEYDVFSYNIFGNSGSFIIKNGQALLINDNNSVKIQVHGTTSYSFTITDSRGYKYEFGTGEATYFDSDNACDVDNLYNAGGVTTAWFLTEMVSPGKNKITFSYGSQTYNYLYDFTDYWTYSGYHPAPPSWCGDGPLSGGRTSCIRRKHTATKMLEMVTGDNFIALFDYIDRDDMYGGKLLKKIEVSNSSSIFKRIDFNYNKVTASTSFEDVIANNLDSDPHEHNSLKTRYFLESVLSYSGDESNMVYRFKYITPELLPHRFSLSKDYMGCFNGQANSGLVPREAIDELHVVWNKSMILIPFANRKPYPVGTSGLLSTISYPTGGRDSIVYEPNQFKYLKPNNTVIDSVFAMYRVKKVITKSGTSPDMVKNYRYDVFTKLGNELVYTDSSSLITRRFGSYAAMGVHVCSGTAGGGNQNFYLNLGGINDYPMFTIRERPNESPDVYGGLPYAYKFVTEFNDENRSSFVASEYKVTANENAYRDLVGYYYPGLTVVGAEPDNSAWDHGLELMQYVGGKVANKYLVDKENKWYYKSSETRHYNYSSSKACQIYNNNPSERAFGNYVVKKYPVFRHWTRLDSVSTADYYHKSAGYDLVANKTVYRYNVNDKQVEEEETEDSDQDILLKQIYRPAKMVSSGQDPTGVYQAMVDKHVISPEIKVFNKNNNVQIGMIQTSYEEPFSGLFVPKTVVAQKKSADPLRTRVKYLRYDTAGNLLSLSREDGVSLNYIYSYKKKYPVIKIVGVDYASIEAVLTAPVISSLANNHGRDLSFVTTVEGYVNQLKAAFPGAQISSYRYLPHVGMIAEKDMKGQTTYYSYDMLQRLKVMTGEDGIIKTFDYNFKGGQ